MDDIHSEIDSIDYTVIQLLASHFGYVKTACKFKKITADLQGSERFKSTQEKQRH